MSLKSEAYKKDLGNPAYRNSEYWQEREKAKKQANNQIEPKNRSIVMPKFCDTGLGLGVSMGDF